jgi:hypothetical protein
VRRIYQTPLLDTIVASLRDVGPQTRAELAEHLGKRESSVYNSIAAARPLFRIASWRRSIGTSGKPSPVWTLQTSKHAGDAPRPEPETRNQINARWRANNVASLRAAGRSAASPWDALLPPGARRT